jgi:hypothetical protein
MNVTIPAGVRNGNLDVTIQLARSIGNIVQIAVQ